MTQPLIEQNPLLIKDLTTYEVDELRVLVDASEGTLAVYVKGNRYFVEELQSLLEYYDKYPHLRDQMGISSYN